ncbi:TPA: DUF1317 family protein, partial [Escherichia coli]|nr:DUF1317 family protein [Escherichia coli]
LKAQRLAEEINNKRESV